MPSVADCLRQHASLSPTSQLCFLKGLEGVGVGFHAAKTTPDGHGTGWALALLPLPTTKLGNHQHEFRDRERLAGKFATIGMHQVRGLQKCSHAIFVGKSRFA